MSDVVDSALGSWPPFGVVEPVLWVVDYSGATIGDNFDGPEEQKCLSEYWGHGGSTY